MADMTAFFSVEVKERAATVSWSSTGQRDLFIRPSDHARRTTSPVDSGVPVRATREP